MTSVNLRAFRLPYFHTTSVDECQESFGVVSIFCKFLDAISGFVLVVVSELERSEVNGEYVVNIQLLLNGICLVR